MFNREVFTLQGKKKDLGKSFFKSVKLSFATIRLICIYMFCNREIFSQCRWVKMGSYDNPVSASGLEWDRTKGNGLKLRWADVDIR